MLKTTVVKLVMKIAFLVKEARRTALFAKINSKFLLWKDLDAKTASLDSFLIMDRDAKTVLKAKVATFVST